MVSPGEMRAAARDALHISSLWLTRVRVTTIFDVTSPRLHQELLCVCAPSVATDGLLKGGEKKKEKTNGYISDAVR